MIVNLPQKYQEAVKTLTPYVSDKTNQIALITIEPSLPCFICSQPAEKALIAPAGEHLPNIANAWLTFPICPICEERQAHIQVDN